MKNIIVCLVSVALILLLTSCSTTPTVKKEAIISGNIEQVGEIKKTFPSDLTRKDRAMGTIMGALIGDALGVRCHWYYDSECLENDYGWIDDYVDPKLDSNCNTTAYINQRIEAGLKKGGPSQTGQFIIMLLESVAKNTGYKHDDYTDRIDEFFMSIDGTSLSGRYTDWAVRDMYKNRVEDGMSWDDPNIGSLAATSEGASRSVILAALYNDPILATLEMYKNIRLTYRDDFIVGQQLVFGMVVNGLIEGFQLEEIAQKHLIPIYNNKEISPKMIQPFDSVAQVNIGQSAWNPQLRDFPPHLISEIFGKDCEQDHLLPAAYWLAHRYPDDFESAILAAINGGGNNMARAILTGSLLGAMNGLSGIPERFINGLEDHERLLELAEIVSRRYPVKED